MEKLVSALDKERSLEFPGARSYPLFEEMNTPVTGCTTMLNVFHSDRYPEPFGLHEDNEGFYVISGSGMYCAGDTEYRIARGSCMLAPAGVPHALRKTGDEDLVVFIYHFPK